MGKRESESDREKHPEKQIHDRRPGEIVAFTRHHGTPHRRLEDPWNEAGDGKPGASYCAGNNSRNPASSTRISMIMLRVGYFTLNAKGDHCKG